MLHRPQPSFRLPRRDPGQVRLQVHPQRGGILTRWSLTGSLLTYLPYEDVRPIFGVLSRRSGAPVELVLPVAGIPDPWWRFWTHMVDVMPEDHLVVLLDPRHPGARRG